MKQFARIHLDWKWLVLAVCFCSAIFPSTKLPVFASDGAASVRYTLPMTPIIEVTTNVLDEYPDVAYNNIYDEYFVVWRRDKSIYGMRISGRGETIASEFLLVPAPQYKPGPPKVAYDPTRNRYLLIWAHNTGDVVPYQLKGRFIPANGPAAHLVAFRVDDDKLVVPPAYNHNYSLAYAYTQDEYLVIWTHDEGVGIPAKVVGRQVNGGGGFYSGAFDIMANSTDYRQLPDVAYNLARNEYMVVSTDYPKVNDNVWGVRLNYKSDGSINMNAEFSVANWPDEEGWPTVAACRTADQYLIAWHSLSVSVPDSDGIYVRDYDGGGSVGDILTYLKKYDEYAKVYRRVDAACGMTNLTPDSPGYLVAWAQDPGYLDDILAREITPDGSMSALLTISNNGSWASVAGGAMNYMVVFDSFGIQARIVGNTRPRAAFTITPAEGTVDTQFEFDAGATTDATDDGEQLMFRWDWENDGVYDTDWTNNRKATHPYALEPWELIKAFYPRLQVKDSRDARDTVTQQVIVRQTEGPHSTEIYLPVIVK